MRWSHRSLMVVWMVWVGFIWCRPAQADPTSLEQMTTTGLTDIQATVTVLKADQMELKKINRDFGMAFHSKKIRMCYKEPNKLRMEGRIGPFSGLYICNGATRFYSVSKLRLRRKYNLGNAPGKRYSLLEIGLISHEALAGMKGVFLRDEMLEDAQTHVFKVTYRGDDSAHNLVWIDPHTRVIIKRAWYDRAGKLKATFFYKNVEEVSPGLWLPTQIEIRNCEDMVAGITAYSNLKVNQGIADSMFDIR